MSSAKPAVDYTQAPSNQQLSHIEGEYNLPFVGKIIELFADPITIYHQHYLKLGPVSRASITGQKMVLLLGPQYLQTMLFKITFAELIQRCISVNVDAELAGAAS